LIWSKATKSFSFFLWRDTLHFPRILNVQKHFFLHFESLTFFY
jgi:hypothetical protein